MRTVSAFDVAGDARVSMSTYSVTRNVAVPMRDGVALMTDLWLPTSQPCAVVLIRTPYDKSLLHSDFLRPQQLVEAGFAAAVQDTRGRFASQGTWRPFMWEQEGEDGYDAVEWLACQSWCSGAVGMAGTSYSGMVQLTTARLEPPHLRAIAPSLAGPARYEREETGGAFWLDHLFGWLTFVAADWVRRTNSIDEHERPAFVQRINEFLQDPTLLRQQRPLRTAPLFDLPGFPISFDDIFGRCVTPDLDPAEIRVPLLSVGGWFDIYVRGSVGLFRDDAGAQDRHLLIGPWTHSNLLPAIQGQCHFGVAASGAAAGVATAHLEFFRRYLCRQAVSLPRVRYFIMQGTRWCESERWPPSETAPYELYLRHAGADSNHGRLDPHPPGDREPEHRYIYDPEQPTPSLGGRLMSLGGLIPGPMDQASLASRQDTLCFETTVQTNALALAGPVVASVAFSVDAENVDLIVKLIDVAPNGSSLLITDGIKRLSGLDPDCATTVEIALADTAWLLRADHILRLQIQSANFPHIDANPIACRAGTQDALRRATVTIYGDNRRLSVLYLNVLPVA